MLECQGNYITECVQRLWKKGAKAMHVKSNVMEQYVRETDAGIGETVFSKNCNSWYKTKDGKVVNNLPSSTVSYWWRTLWVNESDWMFVK